MPALREALGEAGFDEVQTYVQSGNVVLASDSGPAQVGRECERLIAKRFSLNIAVVVRTRSELARVVQRNPLGGVASDPKRYQVSFLAGKPPRDLVERLTAVSAPSERFEVVGREVYA